MTKFRYVAVSPARISIWEKLGLASYLHEFLVDHQTDPVGNVNYGKPFCYAWIRAHWPGSPSERTLRRQMACLRDLGLVWTRKLPFDQGMLVRLIGSVKWSAQAVDAHAAELAAPKKQLPMFPAPAPTPISAGKSEESGDCVNPSTRPDLAACAATVGRAVRPDLSFQSDRCGRIKTLGSKEEEKNMEKSSSEPPTAVVLAKVTETEKTGGEIVQTPEQQARRQELRLLKDMIVRCERILRENHELPAYERARIQLSVDDAKRKVAKLAALAAA